ncbi:Hemerythrin HHE cation binding domain-containing protein [Nakamurella panacisegetis]|uniref:Hemerythrin HHE cation binding domain-containing protein n=1 Tax=Nakamurella panacisegetis TaxID=1090615 RepID=A0A1H0T003_9ACTN|nr:hemerythrin domain-containing protein [Nakamurella panacisegetis]SDP47135.1 Hemerythrin HHE cation binding domain-containing protein [Nakamurella panacisegetis]
MCSYCGCRNIPLIAQLTRQHENITNHTTALRAAERSDDPVTAAAAASVLSELLHPHTELEEQGLFAEMRADDMFSEHIESLCAEHEAIDAGLAAVEAGDLSRVGPLLTLLANHIDREENGLFPAALAYLDDEQWNHLHEVGGVAREVGVGHDHLDAGSAEHHHAR